MFHALTSNVKSFKSSIEAIAFLIDEGTVVLNDAGISVRAMDPSQIAMVDVFMPAKMFEEYKTDKEQNVGINFSELSKVVKRVKSEDKIEMKLDSKLTVTFIGKTTRKFDLGLLEPSPQPREPKIEYSSEIKIGSSLIQDVIKDIELVSNKVTIKISKDEVSMISEGDTSSAAIKISDENLMSKEAKEDSTTTFSLDYLKNLFSAADSQTIVSLKLKTDAPLRVDYSIGDANVTYYLAPRIESS